MGESGPGEGAHLHPGFRGGGEAAAERDAIRKVQDIVTPKRKLPAACPESRERDTCQESNLIRCDVCHALRCSSTSPRYKSRAYTEATNYVHDGGKSPQSATDPRVSGGQQNEISNPLCSSLSSSGAELGRPGENKKRIGIPAGRRPAIRSRKYEKMRKQKNMNMPEAKKLTLPTAHYHRRTAGLPAIAPVRKGCAFQENRTVWKITTAETPQQARGPIAVNTASQLIPCQPASQDASARNRVAAIVPQRP